ncbi:hypothetical protein A3E67_03685 [Candidatus Daviesbacteria bacterium RIFCSPHIGHO2_12_FULL_38_25]|nr:MAG: hypothetical protein A3E67_03685 [Candidatus Daviesbacteria bacterium RIFCSPHIGHO2_12_FULL_38_25]
MKWFKFYGQDYLSDPKILALSGSERSCWITLLSYGSVNDNGMITFLDEQQLMAQSGISPTSEEWDKTKNVLEKLKSLKMITLDNGMIIIINWKKRQEKSLTGYERLKKYREKKRNDNAMITQKITLDKNRIDKKRKEENTIIAETAEWDFKKYLEEMENQPRRDLSIIALYWKFKKFSFTNKKQAEVQLKRSLRAAKDLEPFEDEKIWKTMEWLSRNADFKWVLESVGKYITENLSQLKVKK